MTQRTLHIIMVLTLLAGCIGVAYSQEERQDAARQEDSAEQVARLWNHTREKAKRVYGEHVSMLPGEYIDSIRAALNREDYERAKYYLDCADREYGETSDFLLLRGKYYYQQGEDDQARRWLLSCIREDNSVTDAYFMLANIETRQGNYATAISHINTLLTYQPYDISLWLKKINLYRLMGNEPEADRLLERLYTIYPSDETVKKAMRARQEDKYKELRKSGSQMEQEDALMQLLEESPHSARVYLQLTNNLLRQGRQEEAATMAGRGAKATHGNRTLIRRRVETLMDLGRYTEAENYLQECIRLYGDSALTDLVEFVNEEVTYSTEKADPYYRYQHAYAKDSTDEALDWLIRTAIRRNYLDDAEYYLDEARARRGDTPTLLSKAIMVEERLGNTAKANRLREQLYQTTPEDEDLGDLLAGMRMREAQSMMADEDWSGALALLEQADSMATDSELREAISKRETTCRAMLAERQIRQDTDEMLQKGLQMMKNHQADSALVMADSILRLTPDNNDARLLRSQAEEKLHMYDSAYQDLMRYHPYENEQMEVKRHRYNLQMRSQKNNLLLEYQFARRSSIDALQHNARISYTHRWTNDALTASVGYAGRETDKDLTDSLLRAQSGGTGIQLTAGYEHSFTWGTLGLEGGWSNRFYPMAYVKLESSQYLPADWTIGERVCWRYLIDGKNAYHLFQFGVVAGWDIGQFNLSPSVDAFLVNRNVYANGGLRFSYYPLEGDRSNVFAAVGVGNAPETSFLDGSIAPMFAHLNTNVSAGGMYVVNGHLLLGASFAWYVMGVSKTDANNYLYLNAHMQINF